MGADAPDNSPRPHLTFPRRLRLTSARQFQAVYRQGRRAAAPPLVVFALPNELEHARLGLSVSRRVGGAVARNRIRRLIREAFRHHQHDLPGRYDLVVTVRPHEPLSRHEYERCLMNAVEILHKRWARRSKRAARATPHDPGDG